jgi:hypothetical protein
MRAPTASTKLAVATPNRPVDGSLATIEMVIR